MADQLKNGNVRFSYLLLLLLLGASNAQEHNNPTIWEGDCSPIGTKVDPGQPVRCIHQMGRAAGP